MLSVRDLNVFYGPLQAVRGVSLQVEQGQIVTVLGANGAGKTSVIRAVAGLIPAPPSSITLDGRRLDGVPAQRRVRRGIATVLEGRELFGSLSVGENLNMGAYARRDRTEVKRDLAWIYDLFPALYAKRTARAATLSGGQGQMLAIGRSLMTRPRLLLLDEPSHGLAPNLVEDMFATVQRLRRERDLSILLVEQNANKALSVADHGYVLETGTLALEGATRDLVHDPLVRRLYLGA